MSPARRSVRATAPGRLRLHARARWYGPKTMPRVRRLRREAPTLELLAATLPELRLGLSVAGARTVAYQVFEKLGYGAVAVTDTARVLAFVGAGADHHAPGDTPIRPVFEALAENETRVAPLALRVACGHPACPLGAAAIVPLRLTDGPVGVLVAYATIGQPSVYVYS